ncbi:MAG: RluA family pseudouridine synthase [Oribacterium sinus]|uniref:Pseudouridine synthase n=1 Tax=Oribacterium sinus TaxID=237576 RepID=A0A930E2D4_9FIRM|nr:RluA family pseudouridine synthase [Lachnospiraceae bacterium]MBF1306139.1 RluA family pseudouridine synthase [Oribacterium sinus]
MIQVREETAGIRIDRFLAAEIADKLSRTQIKKLIDENYVLLNGRVAKAKELVKADDQIELSLPDLQEFHVEPENIPLEILYEDEDLLVINKPKGLVVHPAPGHPTGTLVNAILYHCGDTLSGINGVLRPGIVHRIDKDTTGSLVICKTDLAQQGIAEQLKEHSILRIYHAIVFGLFQEKEGIIDAPIGRHKRDRKKMGIDPIHGKKAITHYHLLSSYPFYRMSYIQCRLETGRTHQIRVHMASIGHPLLGDEKYASRQKIPSNLSKSLQMNHLEIQGQCLHAKTLNFIHPRSGKEICIDAPFPAYFQEILKELK